MNEFNNINCRWHLIEPYKEYAITEFGDVYSYRTERGWQGLRKMSLRGINNQNRYLQVCLCEKGSNKYKQVHRLVAKYFCDGFFDGAVVNHIDGNIHNNDYRNLEWITQRENINKSYITSGVGQTRNYFIYDLINPLGNVIETFKGRNVVKDYINNLGLPTSFSSLSRYGESKGYKLIKHGSNSNSNGYPMAS